VPRSHLLGAAQAVAKLVPQGSALLCLAVGIPAFDCPSSASLEVWRMKNAAVEEIGPGELQSQV